MTKPTSEEVIEYLKQHPGFLENNASLLEQIPGGDSDASGPFVERQIQVLKERDHRQKAKIDLIVDSARSNQRLEDEFLEMAVHLLARGQGNQEPDQAVVSMLIRQFNIRTAAVLTDTGNIETRHEIYDEVRQRVAHRGSVCDDRVSTSLLESLFDENSSEIKSCAFIPLQIDSQLTGILVLASTDKDRFQPGMGVLFLDRIGSLIGAYISGRAVAGQ